MLKLAIKEAGLEGLADVLEGTTAIAMSKEDPIAAAKVLGEFAEKNKQFTIKAGFMDGEIMDADKVVALGKLPSKDGLVSMLLSVLVAPVRGMAVALNAIAEQKENA